MKNLNSKLFEKQIDVKCSSLVKGGRAGNSGCSEVEYSYSNGGISDETEYVYDEDGNLVKSISCQY